VIDARSFRLDDGREVRLAGIAQASTERPAQTQALAAMLVGRGVRLSGEDDTPDRYGRELAFVWLMPDEILVQGQLLAQGEAIASADVADKDCAAALMAAEGTAREAKEAFGPIPRP
jgi:endonuclease YncB( thermonuclease family)